MDARGMKTRILKRYTIYNGNQFVRFENKDTLQIVDVRIRTGYRGLALSTEEARAEAVERLERQGQIFREHETRLAREELEAR